jgi:hypothetical protein
MSGREALDEYPIDGFLVYPYLPVGLDLEGQTAGRCLLRQAPSRWGLRRFDML